MMLFAVYIVVSNLEALTSDVIFSAPVCFTWQCPGDVSCFSG